MARRSPGFGLGSLQLRKFRSWTAERVGVDGKARRRRRTLDKSEVEPGAWEDDDLDLEDRPKRKRRDGLGRPGEAGQVPTCCRSDRDGG